ncbi:MAG TPA: hypothetical protein VND96_09645 [Candidatus Micrarchaeaceae archaeon]|nr:hypothetical protein [Candidatus Micrarchaeaceae archaeon]
MAGDVAARYRQRPREELVRLIDNQGSFDIVQRSGNSYPVEVTAASTTARAITSES